MSSQAVEWVAKDLVSLGTELQSKIGKVMEQFHARVQQAKSQEEADTLHARMQNLVQSIRDSFRTQVEALAAAITGGSDGGLYDSELAGVDLSSIVYAGGRDALTALLADAEFSTVVNGLLAEHKPYNARKELLIKGLKLTPDMAPLMYRVIDHCTRALQLKQTIEVYIYHDLGFNAACFPPARDKILLMLTSGLVERFTPRELAFVLGHEIGHYLFEHTRFPVETILANGEGHLSPLHAMRLYAWIRNAEVTADRVGLLCCRDFGAAANAFFKLSSGITGTALEFRLDDYLDQLRHLQEEMDSGEAEPSDWFSTHPFNPLRIKALELFSKSQTYHQLIGQPGGEPNREELANQVKGLMSIMEPVYLSGDNDVSAKAQRWVLTAGFLVAAANGVVEPSELQALAQVVGDAASVDVINELIARPVETTRDEVEELTKDLNHLMAPRNKLQLLRDMTVISYADGSVDEHELQCLYWLSEGLRIDPGFIDHVLASAQQGID